MRSIQKQWFFGSYYSILRSDSLSLAVGFDSLVTYTLFRGSQAKENPGWLKEIRGTHTPETIEVQLRSDCAWAQHPSFVCLFSGPAAECARRFSLNSVCAADDG